MEKDTSRLRGKDKMYEPAELEDPELERLMFEAASREQSLGYQRCLELGIGQQAVWNAYHNREYEYYQDILDFGSNND